MRVAMIGAGYVGLISGACIAEFGHDAVCVDKDSAKIAADSREDVSHGWFAPRSRKQKGSSRLQHLPSSPNLHEDSYEPGTKSVIADRSNESPTSSLPSADEYLGDFGAEMLTSRSRTKC